MEIKKLSNISKDLFEKPGNYGYVSNEVYEVIKNDGKNETIFTLKRRALNIPFVKKWEINDQIITEYNAIINEGNSFGAFLNEEPTGLIICTKREWNNTLYIENLLVSKNYRRMGIGKMLVTKVIDLSKKNNCRLIELETQNTNITAIQFYIKMGFEITGLNTKLYNKLENEIAIFMTREL